MSAALLNASSSSRCSASRSIPSGVQNFDDVVLDASISTTASTEAIGASDEKRRLVPRITRRHSDTVYPVVSSRRGRSSPSDTGPGAEKHSNAKFCLHLGIAIVLTAGVAGAVNMILDTADSGDSEPPDSVQPKQATSPAANYSGISRPNGTTADPDNTGKPTMPHEVTRHVGHITGLKPTNHSDRAVDNASSGSINTEHRSRKENRTSDGWVTQGGLGPTSQGLVHGEVSSSTKAAAQMTHPTVLPPLMPTEKYSKQTTLKVEKQTNADRDSKRSTVPRQRQAAHNSSQRTHAKKNVGITLAAAETMTPRQNGNGKQDSVRNPLPTAEGELRTPAM